MFLGKRGRVRTGCEGFSVKWLISPVITMVLW